MCNVYEKKKEKTGTDGTIEFYFGSSALEKDGSSRNILYNDYSVKKYHSLCLRNYGKI